MSNRISNIDTLSAYIDRLITEHIRLFFFAKNGDRERALHQEIVIEQLKQRTTTSFVECLENKGYSHIGERRSPLFAAFLAEIENLVYANGTVGEADRAKIKLLDEEQPDHGLLILNERLSRSANELRAKSKNEIDAIFRDIVSSVVPSATTSRSQSLDSGEESDE